MPIFEYECPDCGRFEVIESSPGAPTTKCPTCSKKSKKVISAAAIQFKGSGFYKTDYTSSSSSSAGSKSKGAKSGESKSDSTSSGSDSSSGSKKSGGCGPSCGCH